MPQVATLSNANTYRLDIFYVGETNFGFTYPGAASNFPIEFKMLDSSAVVREFFITNLENTRGEPTATCMRNFLSNTGLKNVFMVRFNPSMTVPSSNGFLEVRFPNSNFASGAITSGFDKLGGLTYFNRQAIVCKAYTVTVPTKTAWTGLTRCVVEYGGTGSISRYLTVKILFSANLAAGTNYQFDLFGIDNPTSQGLNDVSIVAGTTTSGVNDYFNIYRDAYHLYAVTPAAATVSTSVALPTLSPNVI